MTYRLSNGHVTDDVTCCEAVRSAILATAWLLVTDAMICNDALHQQLAITKETILKNN